MHRQTHSDSEVPFEPEGGPPYDELRDPSGNLRPHWCRFFEHLDRIGTTEARARWTQAKQLLQENGTSYNVYGDAKGSERPWRLSPIPMVLGGADWQRLSQGIAQRARLLNALLSDLYGAQRSLSEGDIPCELVFDNPHFLRPLHGIGGNRSHWLPLYALDLIRASNGRFLVLEDYCQSPAGMGYALENRIVVAQVLSDLLQHCNVERLVSFFRRLQEGLQASAPHNRDAPRIALLTPGPYSATYFEQAYLAKYLGIALVQGEDLTLRGDRVCLKTLGGLQPIDVLLRRVTDDYCDPLELRPESALGVPGLVQAARSGNISIANPLGTGILETPALLAYLPGLCRKLLGEELLLPSVPTYYCGEPEQLERVLEEFDRMVVKPTYAATGHSASTFVRTLGPAERQALQRQICAAPQQYVAQRFVPSSKTPVISAGELRSRAVVLRCFASGSQPTDYQIMPGGLALVAPSESDLAVSLHHGARSKDVWIVSDEPVMERTLAPLAGRPLELSRGGGDLPSRVADNLYWLGRYTERAEAVGRLARVIGSRLLDFSGDTALSNRAEFSRLLLTLRLQTQFLEVPDFPSGDWLTRAGSQKELLAAVADAECGGSLIASIASALRVSKVVRDRISHDTWRILASLSDSVERIQALEKREAIPQLVTELNQIIITLAGFSGFMMESMTRGFAWRFLDMGRRLERASSLVTLLRGTLVAPCDREFPLVEAVLEVADSGMTYRRRYPATFQVAPAVDLLLADETNPRSVIFQLKTLSEHIQALPALTAQGMRPLQQRLVLSATHPIELCDVIQLCQLDPRASMRAGLNELLRQLATTLPALSDSLTETYMYHADVPRHLRLQEPSRANPASARGST